LINPVLRGWVNYFAIGNSSECFSFVKDWVEKKIRRHMQRSRQQHGFGWKTWSRRWLYGELKLFNSYKVRYQTASKGKRLSWAVSISVSRSGMMRARRG